MKKSGVAPLYLSKSEFLRARWKNGLGYTDQIAIEPVGADLKASNFLWRMSSAQISDSSDFSIFPEHDRTLVVLSGGGVKLTHTADGFSDEVELPLFEPYDFPGDIRSRCDLLEGPVTDLSVFYRKGEVSASVEVIPFSDASVWSWEPRADWNFLFSARGDFEVCTAEGETRTLWAGDALRIDSVVDSSTDSESFGFPVVPHIAGSVLIQISIWN
jgi:environmental stress-induced protein Ves